METFTTGLLLATVGWTGVVALMVWIYRRRRAARERLREQRYQNLMATTLALRGGASPVPDPGPPTRGGAAPPVRATDGQVLLPQTGELPAAAAPRSGQPPVAGESRPRPMPGAGATVAGVPPGREHSGQGAETPTAGRAGRAPEPAPLAPTAPAPLQVRAPIIDAPSRALLLALRAAAPGHEVLVGPSLARLLAAPAALPGLDRALQQRQAAGLEVDFAVCTRRFELVATVDLLGPGDPDAAGEARRAAAAHLEAAGVRHLILESANLPRYPDLRRRLGLDEAGA